MLRVRLGLILLMILLTLSLYGLQIQIVRASEQAQIPTVSIPTVTSSPQGTVVTVTREYDQINVRNGPGGDYPKVGVLIAGQQVPALGRSVGGLWIQIIYPGGPDGTAWVYSPLVELSGSLPIVEPPATPTPRTTPTIDLTLAAQFIVEVPPTRLPTFTPPPSLALPTFQSQLPSSVASRIPMGLLIVGMAVIGLFGTLLTFLRGR